jgi:hypothetical protein
MSDDEQMSDNEQDIRDFAEVMQNMKNFCNDNINSNTNIFDDILAVIDTDLLIFYSKPYMSHFYIYMDLIDKITEYCHENGYVKTQNLITFIETTIKDFESRFIV